MGVSDLWCQGQRGSGQPAVRRQSAEGAGVFLCEASIGACVDFCPMVWSVPSGQGTRVSVWSCWRFLQ